MTPPSAPAWMRDRSKLWNAVERVERRRDAQLSREIQLALPHELPRGARQALVTGFVLRRLVSAGMVADVSIHAPDDDGDNRNHHAHVMLTLREIDGDGFGKKQRAWNDRALLEDWREAWAADCNQALAYAQRPERVDHRSLAAQQTEAEEKGDRAAADALRRLPEPKLGPIAARARNRGQAHPRAARWSRVRQINGKLAQAWGNFARSLDTARKELARQVRPEPPESGPPTPGFSP
jgi:ATP-dependent exoDNAse (exonuclease V) alpha subunit